MRTYTRQVHSIPRIIDADKLILAGRLFTDEQVIYMDKLVSCGYATYVNLGDVTFKDPSNLRETIINRMKKIRSK